MPPSGYEYRVDITKGDDKDFNWSMTKIPVGQYITRGWLTVKREADLGNADSTSVIPQKIITDIPVDGVGGIFESGLSTRKARGKFEVTASESNTLVPGESYVFDIQLRSSMGRTATIQKGHLVVFSQVTES